jgi:hypothetical protein
LGDDTRIENDEHGLSRRRQALGRARRMIRRYIREDEDLTESLIEDRRREAARE